ncbi:MAG: hypothetical protein IAF08_10165 [Rhizobacter sp.]|nr:hypothetical protein [Chlorobiales bacterium]
MNETLYSMGKKPSEFQEKMKADALSKTGALKSIEDDAVMNAQLQVISLYPGEASRMMRLRFDEVIYMIMVASFNRAVS